MKAIPNIRYTDREEVEDISANLSMFINDVYLHILPTNMRSKAGSDAEIRIDGKDAKIGRDILQSVSQRSYRRKVDEALVIDFIKVVASKVATHGLALFELIEGENNFYLNSITPKKVYKFFSFYLQIIPSNNRQEIGKRINLFTKSKILRINNPKELGGVWGQKVMNFKLKKLQGHMSKSMQENLEPEKIKNVDIKRLSKIYEAGIFRITSNWGWNGRRSSGDNINDFYSTVRLLEFHKSLSVLRNHIVDEFNKFLQKERLDCALYLENFSQPCDYIEAKNELEKGNISFSEINELIYAHN